VFYIYTLLLTHALHSLFQHLLNNKKGEHVNSPVFIFTNDLLMLFLKTSPIRSVIGTANSPYLINANNGPACRTEKFLDFPLTYEVVKEDVSYHIIFIILIDYSYHHIFPLNLKKTKPFGFAQGKKQFEGDAKGTEAASCKSI
jgi:hypothetical protein